MTGEIGQAALCFALVLALVQVLAGFWGAARQNGAAMAVGRSAAFGGFVFTGLAFAALTYAYVVSDFSIVAVAQNSHTAKPLIYKISGVWGNHEGSMLLWVLILSLYSALIAITGSRNEAMTARALGTQGLIAVAFLLFVLLTSNPFLRLFPPPFEGNGLNPLLQDPGLAFHPPLLYLGYVGLSAAFSFAIAALLEGKAEARWVRASRPFVLTAWTALTLGIAGGSWWAYYTLGWGGFWFWDPVENASLMPWLIATALFHSMMATERTGAFKSWTLLLAIAAFSFSLIGTFLVRSGVLNSVHAFANDPERGLFILAILVAAIGGSLCVFALRASKLEAGAPFAIASRESAILVNNLFLTGVAATILIGTLYPLILDALQSIKITVGPPYFNATVLPVLAALAIIVPLGPLLMWRRSPIKPAVRTLRYPLAAAAVAALAVFAVARPMSVLGSIAAGLGIWLIAGASADIVRRAGSWSRIGLLGMAAWSAGIAHAGLGISALGVAGVAVWKSENLMVMAPGDTMQVGDFVLRLDGTEQAQGANYIAERAHIAVRDGDGRVIARLSPEKRNYPAEGSATTQSAIRTTLWSDLYVVLGDSRGGDRWVVRAYVNPLAPLIWIGGMVMAFGGALAVLARLRRREARGAAAVPALEVP